MSEARTFGDRAADWLDCQEWVLAPLSVRSFPLWARRLFVLMLPVSAPLWLAYGIGLFLIIITAGAVVWVLDGALELARGIRSLWRAE